MRRPQPAKATLADEEVPELVGIPDGISQWTGASIAELRLKLRTGGVDGLAEDLDRQLCRTIDILGARSQRAQEINVALTSAALLRENKALRLYLMVRDRHGVGILKMGEKKLFLTHPVTRALVEVDPLCVLDFYVDESCQRYGCGKALYEHMLEAEKIRRPAVLAIDRPSPKMLGFMKKHYGLVNCLPQVNNYVVFDRFFERTSVTERGKLIRAASPPPREPDAQSAAQKKAAAPKNGVPG